MQAIGDHGVGGRGAGGVPGDGGDELIPRSA
jgi:hypothetical protein